MEASIGILVVRLDEQRIGLPVRVVQQIIPAAAMAPLPKAPGVVEGVINIHGNLVPVVSLRRRFGLPEVPLDADQHFVVADAGRRRIALRVDQALHVLSIAPDQLEPPGEVAPKADHVTAFARTEDGVFLIYDLEAFLSVAEEDALDRALSTADAGTDPG